MWLGEKNMLSNNELMLFHGTNQLFDEVDLEKSKNKRDFGKGFYISIHTSKALNRLEFIGRDEYDKQIFI